MPRESRAPTNTASYDAITPDGGVNCSTGPIVRDGAHWSPWPWVPGAMLTNGRGPGPAHGRTGSK